MKHFSLDIETLGTAPTAAILSIGMYETKGLEDEPDPPRLFKLNISLASCLRAGLTVDGSTFEWWMTQSELARKALFDPRPVALPLALRSLRDWYLDRKDPTRGNNRIWAHATFDLPIVHHALAVCNLDLPWRYTECRDLRTLLDGRETKDRKRGSEQEHDAGWDAFAQGQQVVEALLLELKGGGINALG